MFCYQCGIRVDSHAHFCPQCGTQINASFHYASDSNSTNNAGYELLVHLAKKEKIAFYLWIGIVFFQILIGFIFPSAWAFALWNSFACFQTHKFIQQLQQKPIGIYSHYENALVSDIIFIILNLILGGIIGALGGCYDLYIRQYAIANKQILLELEKEYI